MWPQLCHHGVNNWMFKCRRNSAQLKIDNQNERDHSAQIWVMPTFELLFSQLSNTKSETTKCTFTLEKTIVTVYPQRKYISRLWILPLGRHWRQHWLWVIYMHALLHLYWCQEKFWQVPEARLRCPSEPYTLNFVPQCSLFHLPFQPFIKSPFISLHQPHLLFTSILCSSLLCSIDFELDWSTALYWKVHAVSSGNAIYLLPVWVCKNLITLSFTSPTRFSH